MKNTLWTGEEVATATAGRLTANFQAQGVAIDARRVQPGDLFIAALGAVRSDIHLAKAQGAVAAIVDPSLNHGPTSLPLVQVDDAFEALCDLARVSRWRTVPGQRTQCALIAGSCGGGLRAEALGHILQQQGRTRVGIATGRPLADVPLFLASMPQGLEWAVVASGSGTVDTIRMTAPDLCWLAAAPRLGAGGAEALARSFDGVPTGSIALLDHEHPHFARFIAAARLRGLNVLSYGAAPAAAARVMSMQVDGTKRVVEASIFGRRLTYKLAHAGAGWAAMSVGVLLAATALGADPVWAAETLSVMTPPGLDPDSALAAPSALRPRLVNFVGA